MSMIKCFCHDELGATADRIRTYCRGHLYRHPYAGEGHRRQTRHDVHERSERSELRGNFGATLN